ESLTVTVAVRCAPRFIDFASTLPVVPTRIRKLCAMVALFVMWNVTVPCGTDDTLFEMAKLRRPIVTEEAAVALGASATQAPTASTIVARAAGRRRRRIVGLTRSARTRIRHV